MADPAPRRCVTLVPRAHATRTAATPAPLVTAWVLAELPAVTVLAMAAGRIDLCLPASDEQMLRRRLGELVGEPRFGTWTLTSSADAAGSGPPTGPLPDVG